MQLIFIHQLPLFVIINDVFKWCLLMELMIYECNWYLSWFIMIYPPLTLYIYIYKSSQTSKSRLGSRRTNGFKTYHLFGIFHRFSFRVQASKHHENNLRAA